ncbi:MAG: DNA polymerase III subunit delta [Erysipelotrichaceae bacterium]|nr:DNA polymerase III subunit delta [Erysipelotrichaceae bacterium]MBQ2685768.1 DNA polymerase III subunit delta [Erysipelotrichaceae bacterium]
MNYLLMGTEKYNLRRRRNEIVNKLIGDDEINISVYRGSEWEISELIADLQTVPFFSDNRVVIVENPGFIVSPKVNDEPFVNALVSYFKKPNESTTFIIYIDQNIDRRRKALNTLVKYMKREVYDTLSEEDFQQAVNEDLRNSGLKLDFDSRNELMQRLPLDLDNWKNELEKLKLYPEKIDREVIRQLVAKPLESNVFELTNAVNTRNTARAIEVYHDLLVNNKNDIQGLIGLLAGQFRFMLQAVTLMEQGYNQKEIAEQLNCREGRVYMAFKNSGSRNSRQLLKVLDSLAQLDQNIKSGKVNPQLGLELFLVETTRK